MREKTMEELVREAYDNMDFQPLEAYLSDLTGIKVNVYPELVSGRRMHIMFESQDLKEHAGILAPMYDYLKIISFGGGDNINKETGNLWIGVNYAFKYRTGGGNGCELAHAWYNVDTKKWKFEERQQ